MTNPYDGLIERLLEPDSHDPACPFIKHCYCGDGAPHDNVSDDDKREAAEALSRLTRDVEEAKASLREVDFQLNGLPEAMRISQPHQAKTADALQELLVVVRAILTRLSRPTDLGADPAFVASQSSPSVSTKGFNRGERKEDK